MKIPKSVKRYCKYCKKHTVQAVSIAKKKERGSLKKGSISRSKKRGLYGAGNKGKTSRGAMSGWKHYGKKSSKKVDLRYKCSVCNKTSVQNKGVRTKKPVLT